MANIRQMLFQDWVETQEFSIEELSGEFYQEELWDFLELEGDRDKFAELITRRENASPGKENT